MDFLALSAYSLDSSVMRDLYAMHQEANASHSHAYSKQELEALIAKYAPLSEQCEEAPLLVASENGNKRLLWHTLGFAVQDRTTNFKARCRWFPHIRGNSGSWNSIDELLQGRAA